MSNARYPQADKSPRRQSSSFRNQHHLNSTSLAFGPFFFLFPPDRYARSNAHCSWSVVWLQQSHGVEHLRINALGDVVRTLFDRFRKFAVRQDVQLFFPNALENGVGDL